MGTHGGKAGRAAKVDYNLLRSTGFLPCRGKMQGKKGERRIACAKPLCFRRALWSHGRIRLWKKLGVAVESLKADHWEASGAEQIRAGAEWEERQIRAFEVPGLNVWVKNDSRGLAGGPAPVNLPLWR